MEVYVTKIDGIMDRVLKKHADFSRYFIPLPQKAKKNDAKFLSIEEVFQRQETGEILDGRFLSPSCSKKSSQKILPVW